MRLLVSVSSAEEARAAIEGGADIVDAKDPHSGALGPVTLDVFATIRQAVGPAHLLTAALGDIQEGSGLWALGSGSIRTEIELLAQAYARAGAALVKVGCGDQTRSAREVLAAAVRGASQAGAGVVAVAYADATPDAPLTLDSVIDVALATGARGVLVDTRNKSGPGLASLVSPARLAEWLSRARTAGLLTAVAGALSPGDLAAMVASGADVVGVRGAACEGGRLGRVTAQRVAMLVARLEEDEGTGVASARR